MSGLRAVVPTTAPHAMLGLMRVGFCAICRTPVVPFMRDGKLCVVCPKPGCYPRIEAIGVRK